MEIRTIDTKFHLSGNWTITGVKEQLDSLSHSLINLTSSDNKYVQVDCEKIDSIDMSGVQLLKVWMEYASDRGIQAKLVNLSESMQQTIQQLGFDHCFADNYPDAA